MKRLLQAVGALLALALVWTAGSALHRTAAPTGEGGPRLAHAQGPQGGSAAMSGDGQDAADGEGLAWGRGYEQWTQASGYVLSTAHGNRLLVVYVAPEAAAEVYRHNARVVRQSREQGFRPYPQGTRIAAASFRNSRGGPGEAGPVFFMRKEAPGYDAESGDWRYAFTRPDLTVLGEGSDGPVAFCRDCHASAERRGFTFAVTQ